MKRHGRDPEAGWPAAGQTEVYPSPEPWGEAPRESPGCVLLAAPSGPGVRVLRDKGGRPGLRALPASTWQRRLPGDAAAASGPGGALPSGAPSFSVTLNSEQRRRQIPLNPSAWEMRIKKQRQRGVSEPRGQRPARGPGGARARGGWGPTAAGAGGRNAGGSWGGAMGQSVGSGRRGAGGGGPTDAGHESRGAWRAQR